MLDRCRIELLGYKYNVRVAVLFMFLSFSSVSLNGQCPSSCDNITVVTPAVPFSTSSTSAGCQTVAPNPGINCAAFELRLTDYPAIGRVTVSAGNGASCNGSVTNIYMDQAGTCSLLVTNGTLNNHAITFTPTIRIATLYICRSSGSGQVNLCNLTYDSICSAIAISNAPLCVGSTLQLNETGGYANGWQWTGPNGFSSTLQNPTITNVASVNAGNYKVVTSLGSCRDSSTVNVVVNTKPTCSPGSDGPLCPGSTLNLTAGGSGATSWQWTGPNGFSSTSQNPSRTNVVKADSGLYKVVVTGSNGCKDSCTINVIIHNKPLCAASSNTPVCLGQTLQLNANTTYATSWQWTGPNGFSSTNENPVRTNMTSIDAGIYKVVATGSGGCKDSCTTTVVVVLTTPPSCSPGSNGPLCVGSTLNLTSGGSGAISWQWTGPNGFSSSDENPSRTNIVKADSGLYQVVVTGAGGCKDSCTINVIIYTKPSCSPSYNGPLCSGETLNLYAGGTGATSWQWTGPNGFSSTLENPNRTNTVKSDSGFYKVVVTSVDGCKDSCTINVIIHEDVNVEAGSYPGLLCSNGVLDLTSLGAFITGGIQTGTWTTILDGSFNNSGKYGGMNPATTYTPGPLEIAQELFILNLTSDDPPGSCEPKADAIMVLINDLTCSAYPWSGNE